jgi:hypothetical protein
MRTLHANLTTSQQAASDTPYVRVELISRDQGTVLTYATDDGTNRVISVTAAEAFWGGSVGQVPLSNGQMVSISAIIQLNNFDSHFTDKDLRGYKINIGWGFDTSSGNRYSEGEPHFVITQSESSTPGFSSVELICISTFAYMELQKIQFRGLEAAPFESSGVKIRQILIDALTDDADAVLFLDSDTSEDSGAFTDETVAAKSKTAGDVSVFAATPAANDAFYIGNATVFDRVTFEFTTAIALGGASITASWEYWNGSAWAALTNVVDDTGNLEATAGVHLLSFNLPTNWATKAVNSNTKYWIKCMVSAASGSPSTLPLIGRLGINRHWGFRIGTSDDAENALTPEVKATIDTSRLAIFREMIDQTHLSVVMEKDGFKLTNYTDAPGSTDYAYSLASGHTFFISKRERDIIIPNRVSIVNQENPGIAGKAFGTDDNATSQGQIGIIDEILYVPGTTDDSEAAARAEKQLERYIQETFQGKFEAPMNCGQEIWDWVGVTDSRNDVTYTGRVGALTRKYDGDAGIYKIQISLGIEHFSSDVSNILLHAVPGEDSIISRTVGKGAVPNAVREGFGHRNALNSLLSFPQQSPSAGSVPSPKRVPISRIRIADSDMIIVSADYNDITWAQFNIYGDDGNSFVIASGSLNLANANPYYLFWEMGTTAVQSTQTLNESISGVRRIKLATVTRVASGTTALPDVRMWLGTGNRVGKDGYASQSIARAAIVLNTITGNQIEDIVSSELSADTTGASKVVFGSEGIKLYDSNSTNTITLNNAGRILIGAASSPTAGTGVFIGSDGAGTTNFDLRVGEAVSAGNDYMHWDGSAATFTISAGAGAVLTDANGLTMKGAAKLKFVDAGGTTRGWIEGNQGDAELKIFSNGSTDININADADLHLTGDNGTTSFTATVSTDGIHPSGLPGDLGKTGSGWDRIYLGTTSVDSAASTDEVVLGGFELSAGNRALAISQEAAVAGDTDETKFSHKLPVRINGATYYIMLTAS